MIHNTLLHAQKLVSQMTIQEKITQMLYQSPAIERLGIPAYNWWNESLHGVARAGIATMFPQAIGMAATFDENLLHQVADIVSTEGRAKFNAFSKKGDRDIYKGITFWAPNINIFRDPRWGRGHETFGEDPYLTSRLGIAYIKGLQGEDREHLKTTACAKHFAVHSGPEGIRHSFDAVVNKKDLYDTYLYAFKRCVQEGQVEAVMGAYNRVNGEPACGSKTLLQDILRDDWDFKGHVVSDCWAILDFHEHHHVTSTVVESAAMAVNNGCDLNCGSAFLHLYAAYEQGLVTEEAIDQAVIRLLDTRIRLGMLEDYPSPYEDTPYELVECKEHINLSLEVAKRSVVLLKNDGLLPLKKENLKSIAVIGPNANSRDGLIGNYVGTSSEYITPLEGIKNYVGDDVRVYYAQGTHLYKDKVESLAESKDRFAEAILAAEMADVVVMCLGLDATIEGEQGDAGNEYASGDKFDLNLPGNQQELLEAVHAVGKPVILLLSSGSALAVKWADENVNAILQTWYIGARGGKVIAELLFGESSPSGKLPITFYNSTDELPAFEDYSMTNRTYRYMNSPALYPFGYGLTYTHINYSNSHLSKTKLATNEELTVTTTVTNAGNYPIHESIQIYIKDLNASTTVPHYALKGMGIARLAPGESKEFSYVIKPRDLALINDDGECWIEPGKFTLYIGGGQPDTRTKALTGHTIDALDFEVIGTACQLEY
ncbi:glycoside hydrolase family 3 protein [Cellulosilyticum sp. WCF-2]|uniref:glycoside hydrolase family 3 protein n=1 Tax=Cellulosilyticum sp. WCF-2 TaxID=2497860 RepID=UPI000F8E4EE1|nr:glycoside hydrolase family 3 protein [Cellulosilyticum sp. WCF-2]QEH67985.1 glycoside hydrolase family 3 protein [Cellulosilyticum sp. WCF-2]